MTSYISDCQIFIHIIVFLKSFQFYPFFIKDGEFDGEFCKTPRVFI